jgi:hypothetical protein
MSGPSVPRPLHPLNVVQLLLAALAAVGAAVVVSTTIRLASADLASGPDPFGVPDSIVRGATNLPYLPETLPNRTSTAARVLQAVFGIAGCAAALAAVALLARARVRALLAGAAAVALAAAWLLTVSIAFGGVDYAVPLRDNTGGSAPPTAPVTSRSLDTVRTVKRRHEDELMRLPGVVGVAIGQRDGEPVIVVYLRERAERTPGPDTIEGVPVDYLVTGEFTPQ